jgi:hypothetical protein
MNGPADLERVSVEGCNAGQAAALKTFIPEKRCPQRSRAEDAGRLDVLAHLGGIQAEHLPDVRAGDRFPAVLQGLGEHRVVQGEPPEVEPTA